MDSVNDELQRRINEHVLNGDAPSIIWAMEGQIRINTELEAKLAELERREALLTACVLAEEAYTSAYEASENIATDHFCEAKRMEFLRARSKLDDAGFPWTDGDR